MADPFRVLELGSKALYIRIPSNDIIRFIYTLVVYVTLSPTPGSSLTWLL